MATSSDYTQFFSTAGAGVLSHDDQLHTESHLASASEMYFRNAFHHYSRFHEHQALLEESSRNLSENKIKMRGLEAGLVLVTSLIKDPKPMSFLDQQSLRLIRWVRDREDRTAVEGRSDRDPLFSVLQKHQLVALAPNPDEPLAVDQKAFVIDLSMACPHLPDDLFSQRET